MWLKYSVNKQKQKQLKIAIIILFYGLLWLKFEYVWNGFFLNAYH